MANLNVRKGDNVMVITGKDKGKSGKVLAVQTKKGRIYVEGVNIVAKSKKPRSAQDKGGILKREGTIDISNVMIICPSCKQVVRVRHEDAPASSVVKTIRVCAKCGASLDEKKTVKKAAAKKTVAKKAEAEKVEKAEVAEETKAVETKVETEKEAPKAAAKTASKASTTKTTAAKATATKATAAKAEGEKAPAKTTKAAGEKSTAAKATATKTTAAKAEKAEGEKAPAKTAKAAGEKTTAAKTTATKATAAKAEGEKKAPAKATAAKTTTAKSEGAKTKAAPKTELPRLKRQINSTEVLSWQKRRIRLLRHLQPIRQATDIGSKSSMTKALLPHCKRRLLTKMSIRFLVLRKSFSIWDSATLKTTARA